jgi:hypothetical protein
MRKVRAESKLKKIDQCGDIEMMRELFRVRKTNDVQEIGEGVIAMLFISR